MGLAVVCAALGAVAFLGGLLGRIGLWRGRWVENYRNPLLPAPTRNAVLALLPFGVGLLLLSPDTQCGSDNFRSIAWCTGAGNPITLLAGLGLIAAGFFVAFFAPNWSKPAWLREAESNNWQGYRPATDHRLGYAIAFGAILVLGAAIFVIGPGTPAEWTGPILISLGIGGGLLFLRKRGIGS